MTLRPGTKFFGSSFADTGAQFVEFVASTDDVALLELTANKMRVWMGDDAHNLSLLERPKVDTQVSLLDTGWENVSTGGVVTSISTQDAIPPMTGPITGDVAVSASSEWTAAGFHAWKAADDDSTTFWNDTGNTLGGALPSWIKVDFGAGNAKSIAQYSIRAPHTPGNLEEVPTAWTLQGNDVDTGAGWTVEDSRSGVTPWAVSQKRIYDVTDTGTPGPWRYWRINVTAVNGGGDLRVAEIEMFEITGQMVSFSGGGLILSAAAAGSTARASKRVLVDTGDLGVEHSLVIGIAAGPVTLRVGSSSGDDDYIRETNIGTGYHNLAFTPTSDFYISLQTRERANRIVSSLSIGDSGTVELTTPWPWASLDDIRFDQSADVVYLDCAGIRQQKIERRGTGRSWSVVDYAPANGPFLPFSSSTAKLTVSQHQAGNGQLLADTPTFTPNHVGALFRLFHEGQTGVWPLGNKDAVTDVIEVTGIRESDTGALGSNSERRISFSVSGAYNGTITIERSMDGKDLGFKPISSQLDTGGASDTGTFSETINDPDDNIKVWYRAKMTRWVSGVANVNITYQGGGKTGICRVTNYNDNQSVDMETTTGFSAKGDTGYTNNWQEGYWSAHRGFPTSVALHGGRASHAQGGSVFLSVSDDYENFDASTPGDAGPIIRTLGSGPVDRIHYLLSLLRLIIGTAGAEIAVKSSSLDEPLTPDNCSAVTFSTQGSANVRALKMDARGLFVQRSGQRVFMVGAGTQGTTFGDYENLELTLLVPDLLKAGIVSIAVQRQPDTRLHAVLADGSVAILLYEPQEEVMAWLTWETSGFVEKAMVLPGLNEDAVYYHIRRTINGVTRRYLEKWAMESECVGDSGLCWLMDCAVSLTDTGKSNVLSAPHLAGENVIVWGSDTGTGGGKDFSPDSDSGVQQTYALDSNGAGTLGEAVHHRVVGLGFSATWKSTKLAYAAELGTALAQKKRVPQIALSLHKVHRNGLFAGSDSGHLDPLPSMMEEELVDRDRIFETLDMEAVSASGQWSTDSRLILKAKAPRPVTILAAIPTIVTHEK